MEDIHIINLFLERSEDAIRQVEVKYEKFCFKIAWNILYNTEDSEECVNDTWLITWNKIPPKTPTKLSAFLGKITRNLALDNFRKKNASKRADTHMMDEEENVLQKIYLTGYVLELKKNRYFAGWYKDRIVCRSLEYARYFPSAEAAEEYVHKYLGFAGMTCYICHVNWTLASCESENMEDNEENLLEENGKILSFANYADVKQYQKQRGMEHSTMAITYASRKKKIILAA